MPAQNIYDDPDFLAGYMTLDRQVRGLDGAAEWPVLQAMVPAAERKRVVDLGCGAGWFSRWAAQQGAADVVGIDLSTKMLDLARAATAKELPPHLIDYRNADLDQLELAPKSADIVFSSLTLHYVQDLERLIGMVRQALAPGGSFVFSVEHPIYSAPTSQIFETSQSGAPIWPLDNYLVEGNRVTNWFVDGVIKQHRTVATYINTLIDAGLALDHVVEWGPSTSDIAASPALAVELHRPWFLLLRASRPATS